MPKPLSPEQLRRFLLEDEEIALLDVREVEPFSEGHLLWAAPLPLSILETRISDLVPRLEARVITCDGGEGIAERAALRLEELGYKNAGFLVGGTTGWLEAGFVTFDGVNVPSKAFGEYVEHESKTPSISADELHAMLEQGDDIKVLDARPSQEFNYVSIPSGTCCPGVELVYRVHDAAPSPDTTVVVNCAGRTRSIIGAQSLIDAGIPNPVVALRNGTMGWQLGGYEPARGETRHADLPSDRGLAEARKAATRITERFGVRKIGSECLDDWRQQTETRTLYVLDVRSREEYEAGHIPGSIHAPGGQLVQNTDTWIATRGARIVLVDGDGVRATVAAAWLTQMGHLGTVVLEGGLSGPLEKGRHITSICGLDTARARLIEADEVVQFSEEEATAIVDLSPSPFYRMGHIEGAWFANRVRLEEALSRIGETKRLLLTSLDGAIAQLAAAEAERFFSGPIRVLRGGNKAWRDAGLPLVGDPIRMADEPDDVWQIPFDPNRKDGKTLEEGMQEYLAWEIDLNERIQRDGTTRFSRGGR